MKRALIGGTLVLLVAVCLDVRSPAVGGEGERNQESHEPIDLLAGAVDPPPGGWVHRKPGRALDGRGRPIAGALIHGVETDADGRAIVETPGTRTHSVAGSRMAWTLWAKAPGYVLLRQWIDPRCDVVRFRFVERGLHLAGRAFRPDGRPAAGAGVQLSWGFDDGLRLETDDEGRFETHEAPPRVLRLTVRSGALVGRARAIPPQAGVEVRLRAPDGEPAERRSVPAPSSPEDGRALTIRLVGARGEKVDLVISYADGSVFEAARLVPDEEGSVRLDVPAGEITQVCASTDAACTGVPGPLPEARARLDLSRQARVCGRVVTMCPGSLDRPVRRVDEGRLALRWAGSRLLARTAFPALSDRGPEEPFAALLPPPPSTAFAVERVGPGRYDLVWRSPCWDEWVVVRRDIAMPDPPRELDLDTLFVDARSGWFDVQVLGKDDRPFPGAAVIAHLSESPRAQRTAASGRIAFPIFDRAPFVLEVEAAGHHPLRRLIDPEREGLSMTVSLEPGEKSPAGDR